jgi:hypothetical protein
MDWLDDKHLVIITILIFGCWAMGAGLDGSLELIEKMAYGLLGLAVGKKI